MWQKIKNAYHLLVAVLANFIYQFPSKKLIVIGVTGTDGKTTTVSLIYHILKEAGYTVSMISSVGAVINNRKYDVGFHVTTPSSFALQKFLKKISLISTSLSQDSLALRSPRQLDDSSNASVPAVASGNLGIRSPSATLVKKSSRVEVPRASNFLVLETTSHALDQYRVFGIKFDIGVLTNITQEHLDYHKTYEDYVNTKIKLLLRSKTAIVNRDDESYEIISKLKSQNSKLKFPPEARLAKGGKNQKLITYGIKEGANITPRAFPFRTNLIGEFNQYNILAAISACKTLKISDGEIRKALLSFNPPIGREDVVYKNNFSVMIDFAHTPNAFEQILSAVRPKTHGRIIHVFGAAGLRDTTKRPLMGEISSRYADIIILTAEDPRTESVDKIIGEIASGIKIPNRKSQITNKTRIKIYKIPDRKEAIEKAIAMAEKGDLVLITGKSHEKSMNYGKGEIPWDEYKAVTKALEKRK